MGPGDVNSIETKRSPDLPHDPPSPKRQKIEIHGPDEKLQYDTDEEQERFDEEWRKSDGFDIDFSKYRRSHRMWPVDMDEQYFADEPETERDLLGRLAREAVKSYNEEKATELEFGKVVKANRGWGGGVLFYITFEVTDPSSSGDQPLVYQAGVRYIPNRLTKVFLCRPRPGGKD